MKKLWLLLGAVVILGLVVCAKPNGAIEVKSTPEGAAVYLDGDDTDEKTNTILADLEPGDYTVKLVLEGYDDYEEAVTVEGGDTVLVEAVLVANAFGALQVNSTPEGAEIWLDGDSTGVATNAFFDSLAVGSHTLKLKLKDYKDWDTTVTIIKDDTVTVDAELSKPTGSLEVKSTPTGAAIWIDDENTGELTDYTFTDVEVGDYVVKLTLEGYKDWDTTVTVNEDETTTIDAVLEEAPQEKVELKYDEVTPVPFGFKMKAGNRMAVEFTPGDFGSNMYPFELTDACYVPIGWADDPDHWDEQCDLVFFGPGEEPGVELGRKTVAATQQGNWNWFDVSNLDITINSGSFFFAVENRVNDNPGMALDGAQPMHHVSWMYTVFVGEIDPKWASFDNISITGWPEEIHLGDSCDLILRVKGMVPGGKEVTLMPTVRHEVSPGAPRVTLSADHKYEVLDWRELR
ncbi:MAG: PEGA domain-containing protein [candidate division WOR-3 bacterium]|nr:PEGA domain-containing protein [candidate division WOR-3 bacterium]